MGSQKELRALTQSFAGSSADPKINAWHLLKEGAQTLLWAEAPGTSTRDAGASQEEGQCTLLSM